MRKRFMNISKRCMVAIMSAAMLMSSVTVSMAFPVGVYAVDNVTDGAIITGEIVHNSANNVTVSRYGHVGVNEGTITANNGTISINSEKIENNNYMLEINRGTVTNNNFNIEGNLGTVTNNYDTVSNESTGTITNQYAGHVDGEGRIENYFDGFIADTFTGTVTNNYADITNDTPVQAVNAPNQFRSVTVSNNNITSEYVEGFTEKTVDKEGNTKQFIQVTEDGDEFGNEACGLITISPKSGYKLSGNDIDTLTASADNTFSYQLISDNGNYNLIIFNPTKALTIDPTTLGLIISQIQEQENLTISQVYVDDPGDTNSTNNDDSGYIPTTTISRTQLLTNAMLADSTKTTFNLEYKNQSNLTWKDFEQLCSTRNNVPKNCYFTIGGKQYILQIPAIDPYTAEFKACLTELQSEENGLAGPLTIARIFKDQGVTCTEIKPQIASATGIAATVAVAPASDFRAFTAQQNAQINALLQQISSLQALGRLDLLQAFTQSGFDLNIANYSMLDAGTCDLLCQVLDAGVPVKIDYTYNGAPYRTTIPADGKIHLSSLASDGVVTTEELMWTFETKTM